MNESMRELLLGYLLDALDEVERSEVERKLAADARWRSELEKLQVSLEPLADAYEEFEPPLDLVERTCSLIEDHAETFEAAAGGLSPAKPRLSIPAVSSPWSLADMVVAVGVCAVAALLFFPAISNSRYTAQLNACQNNLRRIGLALADYSDKAGAGYFPGRAQLWKSSIRGDLCSHSPRRRLLDGPGRHGLPGGALAGTGC